jgi:CO/xanthine dehydrogenase FAD-binding subunit
VVKGAKRCFALFQADTAPSLLVMKAKLKLVKEGAERVVPVSEFYTGRGESPNYLSAGEILTEIRVPKPSSFSGSVYLKYRKRGSIDFPILGVSSMVSLDREGRRCTEARFAFCGVGSAPALLDATDLLAGLDGPRLTEGQLEQLIKNVKPVSHMGMTASLKRRFAQVLLQRAFHDAWIRAGRWHDD